MNKRFYNTHLKLMFTLLGRREKKQQPVRSIEIKMFGSFRTVWYELLFREFPYAKQPAEYIIWRAGNSLKQPLSSVHISKNAKVGHYSFPWRR